MEKEGAPAISFYENRINLVLKQSEDIIRKEKYWPILLKWNF